MSFNRLGVIFLLLLSAMVLVAATPVSTAQKAETMPKGPVKLSEAMLQSLKIVNEEMQLHENLNEVAEKAENKLNVEAEKKEAQYAIEGVIALAQEFSDQEAIAEVEKTVIEETVEEESTTENTETEEVLKETTSDETSSEDEPFVWQGEVLNAYNGVVEGPSGKETYYNLPMGGVIEIMQSLGYDYEYSVREDGVKMYGPYVMCAANLELRPKGTILETSLGTAIVCDTGGFAENNPYQIDIAVDW